MNALLLGASQHQLGKKTPKHKNGGHHVHRRSGGCLMGGCSGTQLGRTFWLSWLLSEHESPSQCRVSVHVLHCCRATLPRPIRLLRSTKVMRAISNHGCRWLNNHERRPQERTGVFQQQNLLRSKNEMLILLLT